ncbi:MAG: hypothetical protein Q4C03_01400 [bacterium]|nr:hypothetical protein [bacterium]
MTEIIGTIICALIASASAITVAVIENRAARERDRAKKRAERRAKESRLAMDLMYAAVGLSMDTAKAMKEGHTNGTLEVDLESAKNARAAYESWLRDEAAIAVAKV